MATEFKLPKLAESVVEGEIVQWLVNEGESVKVDQPLVEEAVEHGPEPRILAAIEAEGKN